MTVDMVSYLQSIASPTPGARPLVGQYLAFFAQETVQRGKQCGENGRFRQRSGSPRIGLPKGCSMAENIDLLGFLLCAFFNRGLGGLFLRGFL
jgi:hypothetical protein